jgi:beta-lactam-binding protein with PASTA domain
VDTRFDPGDPGQVLEVRYQGVTLMDAKGRNNTIQVEKGDYLEFVISAKSGGKVEIPDLRCKTYEEAMFILENLGLKSVDVVEDGSIADQNSAFVITQNPPADGSIIEMESTILITIAQAKPGNCP